MTKPAKVEVTIENKRIASLFKNGRQPSILFIHGFGSSKNTFAEAFERMEFKSSTLLTADLVGFGESDKPINFSYQLQDQALILRKLLDQFGIEEFHLVAHSMGGIVGIELAESIPQRICSFINAEGNLTLDDCTMSGSVAKMSEKQFELEGFDKLKHDLKEESRKNKDSALADYAKDFAKATPKSLHRSALATVQASTSGKLLTRFSSFHFYKCYIYGEKNKGGYPTEQALQQKGIPVFYIPNSGHSMMKDNPNAFYSLTAKVITQNTQKHKQSTPRPARATGEN